jgi:hypothetical protein
MGAHIRRASGRKTCWLWAPADGRTLAAVRLLKPTRAWTPWCVAVIGSLVAAVLALIGVSPLPAWALFLLVAGVSFWGAAISYAFTVEQNGVTPPAELKQQKSRVTALAVGNVVLLAITLGTWVYVAWPATAFVDVVPYSFVVLSPEAGAAPRNSFDAIGLTAGELQSAFCYVTVGGKTWLEFRAGWAPLSEFHYPNGFQPQLPALCD